MMRRFLRGFMAPALLLTVGCISADQRRFEAHVRDKPALDFELEALDGGNVKLSDFRGKPVLLAFWAHG